MLANVLLYGRDPQLLDTRRLLLERAGYRVRNASELSSIECIDPIEQIDLLILCHSLSMEDNDRAIALVQPRWPCAKTLFLTKGASGWPQRSVGDVFDVVDGPAKLLDTLSWFVRADAVHARGNQAAESSRLKINSSQAVLSLRGMIPSITSDCLLFTSSHQPSTHINQDHH